MESCSKHFFILRVYQPHCIQSFAYRIAVLIRVYQPLSGIPIFSTVLLSYQFFRLLVLE